MEGADLEARQRIAPAVAILARLLILGALATLAIIASTVYDRLTAPPASADRGEAVFVLSDQPEVPFGTIDFEFKEDADGNRVLIRIWPVEGTPAKTTVYLVFHGESFRSNPQGVGHSLGECTIQIAFAAKEQASCADTRGRAELLSAAPLDRLGMFTDAQIVTVSTDPDAPGNIDGGFIFVIAQSSSGWSAEGGKRTSFALPEIGSPGYGQTDSFQPTSCIGSCEEPPAFEFADKDLYPLAPQRSLASYTRDGTVKLGSETRFDVIRPDPLIEGALTWEKMGRGSIKPAGSITDLHKEELQSQQTFWFGVIVDCFRALPSGS
ncbi:hypothetical protein GCM10009712_20470 [Pseudarthrobacter sulfonivorans]|uniref:hypothetical protein n=1 Tax=Pseudarthrobacter sulfonivorans TaxID=121292 RepID=UPI00168ABF6C|nr:hypothetical protein [Pseudarthrobacter sulfonivorans]